MQTKLELYELVTPLAGLGIFERNFITGKIYWNKTIREILEVDDDYYPPIEESINFYKRPDALKALVQKAILSGQPEEATLEIISARNQQKWVKLNLQAESNGNECIRIYGTLKDVTADIRLLNLLEEREKRFSMAFDHAPIGMALVSITGEWIKVNLNLCKLLGYEEDEFLKHTFQDFTHPEDLDKDLALLNSLLAGEIESYKMEKRYHHAAGRIIWVKLNVSLVRDEAEKPLYFVSQIMDITEAKESMETIRVQNSRLLDFAHIVSHNLRSHTGNIKMLSDLILGEQEQFKRNKWLEMLSKSSVNLLETLNHLSEVVKVHDGNPLNTTSLNLLSAVQRVLNILAASIDQEQAIITVDISDRINFTSHPAYLESIIINLLSNSLKYKDLSRQLVIKISGYQDGQNTSLCIEDNGQGIDLKLYGSKLFGMYQTFHDHQDSRGLGLFLVKNQVDAIGGHISVASNPGSGTIFTLRFNC